MVSHQVLSADTPNKLIIDSGTSCYLCCDSAFWPIRRLETPYWCLKLRWKFLEGYWLKDYNYFWIWKCQVKNEMSADYLIFRMWHCYLILYWVFLSYRVGNGTDFNEKGSQIYNARGNLIEGLKVGIHYYLNCSVMHT